MGPQAPVRLVVHGERDERQALGILPSSSNRVYGEEAMESTLFISMYVLLTDHLGGRITFTSTFEIRNINTIKMFPEFPARRG